MKEKQIKTGDYVVQVGKGFINEDNKLFISTDIAEICDECALYFEEEAHEKIDEFGGKLYEVVLVEREVN